MTIAGYILIGALLGWFGHEQVPSSPQPNPLVEAECLDIPPPTDPSFGATTQSMLTCVGTYKRCRAACGVK